MTYLIDASLGPVTVQIPNDGHVYRIKKSDNSDNPVVLLISGKEVTEEWVNINAEWIQK